MENKDLNIILNSTGLGFPETSDEIELFRQVHIDYQFQARPEAINAKKILAEAKRKETPITAKDYHKRTVLAAEIVFQLQNEWSLGHLKLQKLIFLCQNTTSMAIHTNFLKQAMGPYDPVLMRSIDSQFKKNKWFIYNQKEKQKYQPLEKVGDHREWYEKYFVKYIDDIDFIIETFRKFKTRSVELIGTIYACWLECLDENIGFDTEILVQKVYDWSDEKQKFSKQEIEDSISWMLEKGIYPENKAL